MDPFVQLFSESAGRALVSVPRSEELRFTEMCSARGLPCSRVGVTDDSGLLDVQDLFEVPLDELREAHEGTLPRLFGPLAGDTAPADPVATAPRHRPHRRLMRSAPEASERARTSGERSRGVD
jgi:hypothetical protein